MTTSAAIKNAVKDGSGRDLNKIADDPSALFPIFREVALEEFTGATTEQYCATGTDGGRRGHLITKTSVLDCDGSRCDKIKNFVVGAIEAKQTNMPRVGR